MEINMVQTLAHHQKLNMTIEMQHSLKILQMPIHDLHKDISKQLEENPLLEVLNDENSLNTDQVELYKRLIKANDVFISNNSTYKDNQIDPLNYYIKSRTLKEHLKDQLLDIKENPEILFICNYIIENIDDKGYLSCSIEEISEELNCHINLVIQSLNLVQNFEPCGIASRTLKECLKKQLIKKEIVNENLFNMVDNYLEFIADNKLKLISKLLHLQLSTVQRYTDIIKSLEPKPSRGFYTGNIESYIIPEAYIKISHGNIFILLNNTVLPTLTINKLYKNILIKNESENTLKFVKNKLNNAQYLIKSIEQRFRTIDNILHEIVEIQRDYFIHGTKYLKPMTISDIAVRLNLSESTISRAIKEKYISTPFSTIKIKQLFTNGIRLNYNQEISSNIIKSQIIDIISNEDKLQPLTDQDISIMFKSKNITISRRTIAKYRNELNITSSSKRKLY